MSMNLEKGIRETMPPVITFIILLIILSTIGITRTLIKSDKISAASKSKDILQLEEINLNENEKEIITMLLNGIKISSIQLKQDEHTYFVFFNCLKNQMANSEMMLSSLQYKELKDKTNELINIMNMEGDKDFNKMSLDGRAVAIDIAGQIYEICGLKLDITMKGYIEQISDQSGNVIYNLKDLQLRSNFHIYALVITLSSIFILIGIILYISKRNHNREEVAHHGFDKKRYA